MIDEQKENLAFDALGLDPAIINQIKSIGYHEPTPIQAKAIPLILTNSDLLGQAQTGTGKTAAFALPLIHKCLSDNSPVQVLVLSPTRELAIQIADSFKQMCPKIHSTLLYGGTGYETQIRNLRAGAQVIVGTPGRVMDHMRKGTLNLSSLKSLVLDEADKMLDMGFLDDVKWILGYVPEQCQRLLFSATMSPEILAISNKYLRNPQKICIQSKTVVVQNIKQQYVLVRQNIKDRIEVISRILDIECPNSVVIFAKTKTETVIIANSMKERGRTAMALNGDMEQPQREYIINQFKNRKIQILVGTDVVARGLDIDHVTHVINFELPPYPEIYIHRIGRTGRIGRLGCAISLVSKSEIKQLRFIERKIHHTIEEMPVPTSLEVQSVRLQLFKKSLIDTIQNKDFQKFIDLVPEIQSNLDVNIEQLLAALLYKAQENNPLFIKEYVPERAGYEEGRSPISSSSFRSKDRDISRSGRQYTANKRPARRGDFAESGEGNYYRRFERQTDGDLRGSYANTRVEKTISSHKSPMMRYRIELGHRDGIAIKDILGALIKGCGLRHEDIGKIDIFEVFTTLYISKDVSYNAITQCQHTKLANKPLILSRM